MDDEHNNFGRKKYFYKRKSKLAYYSNQKKMHFRMFKLIIKQPDPKSFLWIEVIVNIDANSILFIWIKIK